MAIRWCECGVGAGLFDGKCRRCYRRSLKREHANDRATREVVKAMVAEVVVETIRQLVSTPVAKLCRHCGECRGYDNKRGLCHACYRDHDTKAMYPPRNVPGLGANNPSGIIPAEPTNALCGSVEKMKVMATRIERGESLFHPDDNQDTAKRVIKTTPGHDWHAGDPLWPEDDEDE